MIMEFLGNQKAKTPYVVVEKTVLLLVIFSVLRVWLLITVNIDHHVPWYTSDRGEIIFVGVVVNMN